MSVTQLKWAWVAEYPYFFLPPEISSQVVIYAGANCTAPVYTFDLNTPDEWLMRGKLDLPGYWVAGHCVELRLIADAVPLVGVNVHSANYYHSGPILGH